MPEKRPKLLCVEGPDAVGKTSFIRDHLIPSGCTDGDSRYAQHAYGIPERRSSYISEWMDQLRLDIAAGYERIVHDRGIFGNAVWDGLILESPSLTNLLTISDILADIARMADLRVLILSRSEFDMRAELWSRGEEKQWATVHDSISAYFALHRVLVNLGVDCWIIPSSAARAIPANFWWE